MSIERASVFEATQIGVEATPGTAVAALVRLPCTSIELKPLIPVEIYRPYGAKVATTGVVRKEWTEGRIDGRLCFTDVAYLLACVLCSPTVSTPVGATNTRRYTYKPKQFRPDSYKTLTIERGSEAGAGRAAYGLVNAFSMSLDENAAIVAGALLAQMLDETDVHMSTNEIQQIDLGGATGGTFTLSFGAQTTGNIAYDATVGAVQTALEGLSTVGSGNVLVTSGGVKKYLVEFVGDMGQTNVASIVLDPDLLTGETSPAATVVTAGAAPAMLNDVPVSPRNPSVFMGATVGGLAQMDRVDMFEFGIAERFRTKTTLDDREPSWSYAVEKAPTFSVNLRTMLNAEGLALVDDVRAAATKFVRLVIEQDEIETGFPYRLQLTMPFKFGQPDRGDADDVTAGTFEMQPVYDADFGGWIEVVLDTDLASL